MAQGDSHELPPARERQRVPLLLKRPSAPEQPGASLRHLLLHRWSGRLLLGAIGAKLVVWLLELLAGANVVVDALNLCVRVVLLVTLAYFLSRLLIVARRRFLWRVRRRLVVSYIFIGVVPALLLAAFFLFGGALMFLNVSGYLLKSGVDDIVEEARVMAQASAEEIERTRNLQGVHDAIARRIENNQNRYPGLSIALVARSANTATVLNNGHIVAGPWSHLDAPSAIPAWVSAGGFGGLIAYSPKDDPNDLRLVVRAVGFPTTRDPRYGIVVDIPVDEQVETALYTSTGIEPGAVTLIPDRDEETRAAPQAGAARGPSAPMVRRVDTGAGSKWKFNWAVFLGFTDWKNGTPGSVSMSIRVSVKDIYQRISSAQSRIRSWTIGEITLVFLGFIGFLFLIIETAAFVMGFTLARSITRSIHALFYGTERVRIGDFTHRIEVRDRDQLGELAESFNAMTANIEDLLQQAQEKKRLEEELRIAREIQMSLLPRGPILMKGLGVAAICLPAREVGGDYYDFFPLDESKMGMLIADVAGKGTSAALYMAELKGLVLSLSRIYHSPRQMLIEVNRIISDNLDARSFITMTYAVVDIVNRTLTYSRAGHTPLIHLPYLSQNGNGTRHAHVLAPSGMVVGLHLDGIHDRFESLLEELTIPLQGGDVFVLFTDGITEAMNAEMDLFGEDRLRGLIEEHGELSSEELRERILREVEAFVGEADPHDDMTMILLKVEDGG
jgi:sigma-B regulation protein RsbU (phosphoserine phosphatase)